jgi:hypothetical protein
MDSRFTGNYGLTPNEGNDFAVINLISQMGDNPSNPKPAIEAIAVWLANRWMVYNLSDLQFLWHPDTEDCGEHQVWGSTSEGAYLYTSNDCLTVPGYFTAVSKNQGVEIPTDMAMFDDGHATYHLGFKPNAEGKPTFGLIWMNPRSRGYFKSIVLPVIALASLALDFTGTAGYAILGVGDTIAGAAVAGEIAATVGISATQVAQMVGSASIGAVTSGGDPIKAIENTAAAYVGSQAGNFVAGAVDSAAAGKIAAAAVTAGARGQDVGQAILMAGAPLAAGAVAGALTTGTKMDPEDYNYDVNVPTTGYVFVSPEDLGIYDVITIDESAAAAAGVDQNAVYFNDDGEEVDSFGQTVSYTAETFAVGFNLDEKNNILGPDNRVILTREETAAILAANEAACNAPAGSWRTVAGLGAVCLSPQQAIANEVQRRISLQTDRTVIPGTGSNYRPANIPPPNPNGVKMPDAVGWAAAGEAITRSVANMLSIIKQVESGTYRPGAVSPYGTPRPPVPGIPVTNRDGSVVVNNGNGTQTVTYPNGTRTTMPVSVAGTGAGTFGGISTNTLLLAGAGLAALLLLRRK